MTERIYTYCAVIPGLAREVELNMPTFLRAGDDIVLRGERFLVLKVISAVAPAVLPRIYLRRIK